MEVLFLGTVQCAISGISHDGRVKLYVQPRKCQQGEPFFPDSEGRVHWIFIYRSHACSDWEVIHSIENGNVRIYMQQLQTLYIVEYPIYKGKARVLNTCKNTLAAIFGYIVCS